MIAKADLAAIRFESRFVAELPGDFDHDNRPRQVHGACYSRVNPSPVPAPRLLAFSNDLRILLGWPVGIEQDRAFAEVFSGNRILPGMAPYAACYGGFQFGNWAGQLGDGRAITLGEVIDPTGQSWEIQLKGAGPTPYSRSGDGRAVLRSSLREFLCSEAMHHLGVPTTRALSLVATGAEVVRDMLYDGHPCAEPGAVVCRVAPTFLRFGNFEILTARKDHETLRVLMNHTIDRHFPDFGPSRSTDRGRDYVGWFSEICRRTAVMIDRWMSVGFVHGVMNTDNMSVLGLTIDYGPYGWLEGYDPHWTPNTTDASGRRYRFANQPQVALWNLVRFAEALLPVVDDPTGLQDALAEYGKTLNRAQQNTMTEKLGLATWQESDVVLVNDLFDVLCLAEIDMTIFFRSLIQMTPPLADQAGADVDRLLAPVMPAFYAAEALTEDQKSAVASWLRRYLARVLEDDRDPNDRVHHMRHANPKYVLRNYLAQQAIDDATRGDLTMVHDLMTVLRRPYDDQPDFERFATKRPEWARHKVGCSMLSCSS